MGNEPGKRMTVRVCRGEGHGFACEALVAPDLRDHIAGARLEMIASAGRASMLAQSVRIERLLREFLGQGGGRG